MSNTCQLYKSGEIPLDIAKPIFLASNKSSGSSLSVVGDIACSARPSKNQTGYPTDYICANINDVIKRYDGQPDLTCYTKDDVTFCRFIRNSDNFDSVCSDLQKMSNER